jgi:hypothetical protein
MSIRGIVSFAAGGAFFMLTLYELLANAQSLATYYNPYPLIVQTLILGFISFLLMGLGLQLIINEGKQQPSKPRENEKKTQ